MTVPILTCGGARTLGGRRAFALRHSRQWLNPGSWKSAFSRPGQLVSTPSPEEARGDPRPARSPSFGDAARLSRADRQCHTAPPSATASLPLVAYSSGGAQERIQTAERSFYGGLEPARASQNAERRQARPDGPGHWRTSSRERVSGAQAPNGWRERRRRDNCCTVSLRELINALAIRQRFGGSHAEGASNTHTFPRPSRQGLLRCMRFACSAQFMRSCAPHTEP